MSTESLELSSEASTADAFPRPPHPFFSPGLALSGDIQGASAPGVLFSLFDAGIGSPPEKAAKTIPTLIKEKRIPRAEAQRIPFT
eukprot:1150627-Pelagomonas_calceolata.AAC.2